MDAFIRSLITGQEEMILDAEITRKNITNGQKTLDVTARQTAKNQYGFVLLMNENYVLYGDDEYVIKNLTQNTKGRRTIKTFTAEHRFYEDLISMHIYETLTGTYSMQQLCDFALAGTGYGVQINVDGLNNSVEVENFGDDNSSALFQSAIEKFGCEYEINGKVFTIAKELSRHTDYQFRYLMNAQDPQIQIDTTNLCTYIRGYGKQNEDGSYVTQAEYTSPLAQTYGIRHAAPIRDERFTQYDSLLAYIKAQLTDSIPITITLTALQLESLGVQDVRKGDYCWVTLDPFGIDLELRVSEVDDYNTGKSPLYTFGVLQRKAEDILSGLSKTAASVPLIDQIANSAYASRFLSEKVGEVDD
ncbi:phage tail protein [Sporolactobacillus sp. STSJ-5]|uniref:phage tail protein n=1 Tax=Sporolactobacillus sp. STSJ-5 TaxID=2965076 RepID=UPI0021075879|nr:phage tail protein [Sporolactobacillus sp. STSJ-5]MCQ2010540.1 phage tail protein [Sporolactobacillus sp. STSJ-5]